MKYQQLISFTYQPPGVTGYWTVGWQHRVITVNPWESRADILSDYVREIEADLGHTIGITFYSLMPDQVTPEG